MTEEENVSEDNFRTFIKFMASISNLLSNKYWAEGIAIAVYILNKCPTKSVKNIVPQEA
jgi:hypothetical protein